jgi:hypothetical protein
MNIAAVEHLMMYNCIYEMMVCFIKKDAGQQEGQCSTVYKSFCVRDNGPFLKKKEWEIVMVDVMAPYQEIYKDMQKKAQQSNITTFFTKVLCHCLFPALCVITAS